MAKVRLYSYEPWTNGNCVDTNCDSPRVGKSVQMLLRDGTRADTLRCHDCGIELPGEVWRRAKRENRSFDTLTKMSRKLIAPMNGTEESIHYRAAHGIIPPPKVKGPARRERITEGEAMAKKKAKKSKKVKKAKAAGNGIIGTIEDTRVPKKGTVLRGEYGKKSVTCKVTSKGFHCEGKTYLNLSDLVIKKIGGTRRWGMRFFGLTDATSGKATTRKSKKASKKAKKGKKARRIKA